MTVQIRCYGCGTWFYKSERACPDCEAPLRTRNGYLRKAQLNEHLYAQAEAATRPPTGEIQPWARERAKKLMEQM